MTKPLRKLQPDDHAFLARFVRRGWLAADRTEPDEEAICRRALRLGYLRRERTEYQFTARGESTLIGD